MEFWKKLSNVGDSEDLSDFDRKSIVFLNRIAFILILFVGTSIIINLLLGSNLFIPVLSVALLFLSFTYILNSYKFLRLSKFNLLTTTIFLLNFMVYKAGFGSGLEYYLLSSTVLPFIIFKERKLIIFFQFIILLSLAMQRVLGVTQTGDAIEYKVFYIVNSFYSGLFIILAIRFYRNINKRHESLLINKNRLIADKNALLESKNKELDAFSYYVSHDLQAPLRSINGFSQILLLRHAQSLEPAAKELLQNIQASGLRMKNLIDDLLTLSHSGTKDLNIVRINVNELISEILKDYDKQIKLHQTEVYMEDLKEVEGDRALLHQAFLNLINNAVKYSRKKERPNIRIGRISEDTEMVTFFIKDNGTGFDMKYADKLFSPFQRLHNFDEFEGTGIGLAIVESIVRKHGGKVWAEGKETEGATFYIQLPLKQAN